MTWRIWIVALVWCGLVAFGGREIYGHETTEGARAAAPERWPADSGLAHSTAAPTLIMFVHPDCPCTRASLGELAEIERNGATVEIVVAGLGDGWTWAGGVRGAIRVLDPAGLEAARFGAATSGQVVVYDAGGTLRYAGGITGARGHAGDNVGRRTVARILAGADERDLAHAVFGCAL